MKQSASSRRTSVKVIALHCSGGNAGQWRQLAMELDRDAVLHTPEHRRIETSPETPCQNERPFTLADEAVPCLQLIDRIEGKVHLVGHSYGGSLALHIALARPERIASVALFEPCAFHLLGQLVSVAAAELDEIHTLAASVRAKVSAENATGAMQHFVDYWSGAGAWYSLKPGHRDSLVGWAQNAPIGFDALLNEATRLAAYRHLHVPVRLLQGDTSPKPVKAICNALLGLLPNCSIDRLSGIGHMGPITHADYVARLIAVHIESCARTEAAHTNISSATAENSNSDPDNAAPIGIHGNLEVANRRVA